MENIVLFARFISDNFDSVLGLQHLAQHTGVGPCFSLVPEATHEARLRDLEERCVVSKSLAVVRD